MLPLKPPDVWLTGGKLMKRAERENLCSLRVAKEARENDRLDLGVGFIF